MQIKLPSLLTTLLGGAAAVVVVVSKQVLHFAPPWPAGISAGVTVLGVLSVSVLTGPQFRAAIKLTQAEASVVAMALSGVQLLLLQSGLSPMLQTILQAILVAAGTLGFGPDTQAAVMAERRRVSEAYVSVDGDDRQAGTSKATAKRTVAAAVEVLGGANAHGSLRLERGVYAHTSMVPPGVTITEDE